MTPEYVNLITSDSDFQSQSDHFVESVKMKQLPTGQDNYQKFVSSSPFVLTNSLKIIEFEIIKFIQNASKRILFIFGPSGCGKKALLMNLLHNSYICYQKKEQYEKEDQSWERLPSIINQTIQRTDASNLIYLFNDFPISTQGWNLSQVRKFKKGLPQRIKKSQQKVIFLLNSEIYNSFYILSESNPVQRLDHLKMVSVIKMQGFGKRQMKQILNKCCQNQGKNQYLKFLHDKNTFDEITQLANGDARKSLNLLYWKLIQEKSIAQNKKRSTFQSNRNSGIKFYKQKIVNRNQIINQQFQREEDFCKSKYEIPQTLKTSLFHALGKLLYGKRLNIKNHFTAKKKQISCYYNQQEMKRFDPPFYFNPVQLFQKTHSPLNIFASLLQQNYLNRYGKISDVVAMNKVFMQYNSLFSNANIFQNSDIQNIRIILVTWGMLICNKNSRTDFKTLQKIERSKCNSLAFKLKQKKQLLKKYYSQFEEKDLIVWSHLLKKKLQRQKYGSFQKNIYDIIFSNRKNNLTVQDNVQTMKEFQEQDQSEDNIVETLKIKNSLNEAILQKQRKNKLLEQILMEDQCIMSDIDEQP